MCIGVLLLWYLSTHYSKNYFFVSSLPNLMFHKQLCIFQDFTHFISFHFNPYKMKRRLLYLKTQFVP